MLHLELVSPKKDFRTPGDHEVFPGTTLASVRWQSSVVQAGLHRLRRTSSSSLHPPHPPALALGLPDDSSLSALVRGFSPPSTSQHTTGGTPRGGLMEDKGGNLFHCGVSKKHPRKSYLNQMMGQEFVLQPGKGSRNHQNFSSQDPSTHKKKKGNIIKIN